MEHIEVENLVCYAMEGQWRKVYGAYENNHKALELFMARGRHSFPSMNSKEAKMITHSANTTKGALSFIAPSQIQHLKPFDVPVLNYTGGDGHHPRGPCEISEDMRALGIYSRLDQIFYAPFAGKEVVIGQFNLDHSYIGSKETEKKVDEVPKLGIVDLWTPENHYHWSKSRYGNYISAVVEQVGRPQFILDNLNVGEIEKLTSQQRELEGSIATLEENVKRLQGEEACLVKQAAELRRKLRKVDESEGIVHRVVL